MPIPPLHLSPSPAPSLYSHKSRWLALVPHHNPPTTSLSPPLISPPPIRQVPFFQGVPRDVVTAVMERLELRTYIESQLIQRAQGKGKPFPRPHPPVALFLTSRLAGSTLAGAGLFFVSRGSCAVAVRQPTVSFSPPLPFHSIASLPLRLLVFPPLKSTLPCHSFPSLYSSPSLPLPRLPSPPLPLDPPLP